MVVSQSESKLTDIGPENTLLIEPLLLRCAIQE